MYIAILYIYYYLAHIHNIRYGIILIFEQIIYKRARVCELARRRIAPALQRIVLMLRQQAVVLWGVVIDYC